MKDDEYICYLNVTASIQISADDDIDGFANYQQSDMLLFSCC